MIRLLCIGLGGMGRHDWSSAVESGGFTAVAGVDVAEEPRTAFTAKTGAPTFDSFEEALEAVEADAVLVSTPDRFHAPLAIAALERGMDVICEKPMAESLEDGRRMHAAAEANGRMLMIHHQLRWHPMHFQARRLMDQGAIGAVRRIDFTMSVHSDVCLRGYRSRLPHLVLQDLSIHHLDLIRFLSGQECQSLYVQDWASVEAGLEISATTEVCAILNMSGPVTVNYTASLRRLMDHVGYVCSARIAGSEGEMMLGDERITLQTRAGHAAGEAPRAIVPEPPEVGTWQAFARAMETRQPTLTGSGDNIRSLELLFAAVESAETGAVVAVGSADTL